MIVACGHSEFVRPHVIHDAGNLDSLTVLVEYATPMYYYTKSFLLSSSYDCICQVGLLHLA